MHFEETVSKKIISGASIEDIAKRKIYYAGSEDITEWVPLRVESEIYKFIRIVRMKYLSGSLNLH